MTWLPLKRVADVWPSNVDKLTVDGEQAVRLVNYTDVYYGDQLNPDLDLMKATATSDEIAKFRLHPGDVIITKDSETADDIGISAFVEDASPEMVCGYHLSLIRPREADGRYLHYAISSTHARRQMSVAATGVTRFGLRSESVGALNVWVPPLAEQRAIADYLDAETARIDALITKKQQLIHLLEERRSASIGAAVTTGLEPRPLHETGDELVPEVPAGWRLVRLRHLVERIVDTPHKTAPVIDDDEYLVVRTANVKNGQLVYEDARYTDLESWREWSRKGKPRPGDVLFTREAPAGEACVVPTGQPLCLGQRMVLLQVDRRWTTGEWLVHSIYSGPAQRFIEIHSNSTTVAHLNMSDIPDIPVVVPPLGEQSRLLTAVGLVDDAVHRGRVALTQHIDLLAEHRQALITAAVAGELALSA